MAAQVVIVVLIGEQAASVGVEAAPIGEVDGDVEVVAASVMRSSTKFGSEA